MHGPREPDPPASHGPVPDPHPRWNVEPRRDPHVHERASVELRVAVHPGLWFLLPRGRKNPEFVVVAGANDTLGHVVSALGIPLTEVGALGLDGRPVLASAHVAPGRLRISQRERPQSTAMTPPRFLLDVHLGALARRLRLLGLDTAYETHADDAALVRRAADTGRVLLTRDRSLLFRAALPEGALVRGTATADQLDDVLDRFAPALTPWTRCLRCNGLLAPASAADVATDVEPGTRRTYDEFARCAVCAQVYWHGAHAAALESVVERAERVVAAARPLMRGPYPS